MCSGNAFLKDNGHKAEIKEKQWAVRMEPDNPLNYVALGDVFLTSLHFEKAIAEYDKALERSPGLNRALVQKGTALWRMGKKKNALEIFKSVLYSPKQEGFHLHIAQELGCPFQISRISDGHGEYAFPAPSPVDEQLLCQSTRDGNWEVYLLDFTGRVLQRLTNDYARDEAPAFAPDGVNFAFTTTRDDSMNTSIEQVTRNIYIGNIKTDKIEPLVRHPADDWAPVFSPDGRSLLFLSDRSCGKNCNNLYEIDLKTKKVRRLTDSDHHFFLGDYMAHDEIFISHDGPGVYHIFRHPLSGAGEKPYFQESGQQVGVRLFGREKMTFFSNQEKQYDIFLCEFETGTCLKLTCHPATDAFPDFSHDGQQIFFHSNREANRHQIFAVNLDRQKSYDNLVEVVRDLEF